MTRGFLSGVLVGGLVSLGAAGVTSVLAPPPLPPVVGDAAPGVSATPARIDAQADQASEADGEPQLGAAAPQSSPPSADTLAALDAEATQSAAVPQTGSADRLLTPDALPEGGGIALEKESAVQANPQALALTAPAEENDPSISTEPAQPFAPQAEALQGAFDEEPRAAIDPDMLPTFFGSDTAPRPEVATRDPEMPAEAAEPSSALQAAHGLPDALPEVPPTVAPDSLSENVDTAPDVERNDVENDRAEPVTETSPSPKPQAPEPDAQLAADVPATAAQSSTDMASLSEPDPSRPRIGTPALPLIERDSAVAVNRPAEEEDTGVAALPSTTEDSAPTEPVIPPIKNFAADVPVEGKKPQMAIVLIDDGTQPTAGAAGIAALRSFPYPLSFAVDANMPEAEARMALYRDEGFEVLAMVDLPPGARPSDAETTFGVVLPRLDEVVGVLEGANSGFQDDRSVADQVTEILAASGHGLVTQNTGLNTMPTLARKNGVPAAPVFRDIDSKGQTAVVIRRFMDQAAFKAGQEGSVIMLGRLRPDTISALLLWGRQDRASTVEMVPISTVLMQE